MPQFVDGFPDSGAPAHAAIDAVLRGCHESWVTKAPLGHLFPGFFKTPTEERRRWLPALMERMEWHSHRDGEGWTKYLSELTRLVLEDHPTGIDDSTLSRIAKWLPDSNTYGLATPTVAKALASRRSPLPDTLAKDLRTMSDRLIAQHDHSAESFAVAFYLFRHGYSSIQWIDTATIGNPLWRPLLNLAFHDWFYLSRMSPKHTAKIAAAIETLGNDTVASFVTDTVKRLKDAEPVTLTGAGMTMLRQIILWVQAVPAMPLDDALYELCGIRWNTIETPDGLIGEWIGTLLQTLPSRGDDRAFACVERLVHNVGTKDIPEVRRLYEHYGASMTKPTVRDGVDGFPVHDEWQAILDDLLRRPLTLTRPHVDIALHHAKRDPAAMLRAMNERTRWLNTRQPIGESMLSPWLKWRCDLANLYSGILEQPPGLDAADLAELCEIDALKWLAAAPTGYIIKACEARIASHGFEAPLIKAMTAWHKTVHGGSTMMMYRKQIGWLLWFDTTAPIKDDCWSSIVRKDLRAMRPETRGPWIALLSNICQTVAEAPTKKWLKPAEKLGTLVPMSSSNTSSAGSRPSATAKR